MRFFSGSLAPRSEIGRVILAVLVAVLATVALLAWAPGADIGGPQGQGAARGAGTVAVHGVRGEPVTATP